MGGTFTSFTVMLKDVEMFEMPSVAVTVTPDVPTSLWNIGVPLKVVPSKVIQEEVLSDV